MLEVAGGEILNQWPLLCLVSFFNVMSLVCVNLVNIYFASAGWETLIRTRWRAKEYAIVGLVGTVVYVFVQLRSSRPSLPGL